MNFKSTIENIDDVTKKIVVSIPSSFAEKEYEEALSQLTKGARIDGFRPGKAPRNMVQKLHGSRVRLEVAHRLIRTSLGDLLKEKELKVVGSPEIDLASYEAGKDIEYTAQIFLMPEPVIEDYKSFEIKIPKTEIGDREIEEVVNRVRDSKATIVPLADRSVAATGDVIEGVLTVTIDGADPGPEEPVKAALGENKIPSDLEQAIIGQAIGSSIAVDSVVPEDAQNEQLRGKKVRYDFRLDQLFSKELPQLDDDLVKGMNIEAETVLELRLKIREDLEQQAKHQAEHGVRDAIMEQLIERHQFPIPQVLIDREIASDLARAGLIDPSKISVDDVDVSSFRDRLGPMADKRARAAIIFQTLLSKEQIQVTAEDLEQRYQDLSNESGVEIDQVRAHFSNPKYGNEARNDIIARKLWNILEGRSKVEYVAAAEQAEMSKKGQASKK